MDTTDEPAAAPTSAEGAGGFFDVSLSELLSTGLGFLTAKEQSDSAKDLAKIEAKNATKTAKLDALKAFAEAQTAQANAVAASAAANARGGKLSPTMLAIGGVAVVGAVLLLRR